MPNCVHLVMDTKWSPLNQHTLAHTHTLVHINSSRKIKKNYDDYAEMCGNCFGHWANPSEPSEFMKLHKVFIFLNYCNRCCCCCCCSVLLLLLFGVAAGHCRVFIYICHLELAWLAFLWVSLHIAASVMGSVRGLWPARMVSVSSRLFAQCWPNICASVRKSHHH